MHSQAHNPLTPIRKKNSQHSHNQHKKPLLFVKYHAFLGDSPENENESGESVDSHPDSHLQDLRTRWSTEQDFQLISLFRDFGAHWEEISNHLSGRSHADARSHFQKILRKVIQNMNKKLRDRGENEINFRKMKIAIEAKEPYSLTEELATMRDQISSLMYQGLKNEKYEASYFQKSLEQAKSILSCLKKNRMKKHSSKASTEINLKSEIESLQLEKGYMSDSSSVFEEPKEDSKEHSLIRNIESCYADEEQLSESLVLQPSGVVVEESEEGIKDLLRESGVLQVEEGLVSQKSIAVNCQESIASGSQNLNNESYQHFYEESELERDCYWKKSCSELNNPD